MLKNLKEKTKTSVIKRSLLLHLHPPSSSSFIPNIISSLKYSLFNIHKPPTNQILSPQPLGVALGMLCNPTILDGVGSDVALHASRVSRHAHSPLDLKLWHYSASCMSGLFGSSSVGHILLREVLKSLNL